MGLEKKHNKSSPKKRLNTKPTKKIRSGKIIKIPGVLIPKPWDLKSMVNFI